MREGTEVGCAVVTAIALLVGVIYGMSQIKACSDRIVEKEKQKTEQVSDSTASTSQDSVSSVQDLTVNNNNHNSIVSFNNPQSLRHVRLVGYQTYSVDYFFSRDVGLQRGVVFPGAREYNVCTFDDGTRNITLMTKSPTALVPYNNYSLEYFQIRKDINLNAEKYIKEYVGKHFSTLDNYPFDKNIEGVIENLVLEVKK